MKQPSELMTKGKTTSWLDYQTPPWEIPSEMMFDHNYCGVQKKAGIQEFTGPTGILDSVFHP